MNRVLRAVLRGDGRHHSIFRRDPPAGTVASARSFTFARSAGGGRRRSFCSGGCSNPATGHDGVGCKRSARKAGDRESMTPVKQRWA